MEEADIEVTDIAELRKRKCKKVLAERDTASEVCSHRRCEP